MFFPYLKKHNITTVFHLGDIVDRRKFINYVTLNTFRSCFVKPCIDNNITLHVLVGNHDVPYRNSNTINAMEELFGNYFKERGLHIYASPTEVVIDGVKIALTPWFHNDSYKSATQFIKKTKAEILFGHLELSGFEMYRGQRNDHGMDASVFSKFDIVATGHYHHKSSRGNIHYLGNPYEITWNDYNDNRGFHVFDTETRELEFVQNPYRMFHKLWYDDENKTAEEILSGDFSGYQDTYVKIIVQSKTNPYWFDMMVDKLYKCNPADITIVDDHKNIDKISEDEAVGDVADTVETLERYVEALELFTSKDKKNLKKLLKTLYNEAQHMEL